MNLGAPHLPSPCSSVMPTAMTPATVPNHQLCVLLLLSCVGLAGGAALCNNRCCSFVEGFPARLKILRENYSQIQDFYVSREATCSSNR